MGEVVENVHRPKVLSMGATVDVNGGLAGDCILRYDGGRRVVEDMRSIFSGFNWEKAKLVGI